MQTQGQGDSTVHTAEGNTESMTNVELEFLAAKLNKQAVF